MSAELVALYADESCLGNGQTGDNPGAAGVLIEYQRPDGSLVRRDLWVSEPATTNNRMALRSVIEAMRAIGAKGARFRVVFTSDSRYIVDGMTGWVHGWARNGWKRKTGPIENLALWHDAIAACDGHAVMWRWVRGHAGHAQNEYANHLATRAAADQTSSGGLVESAFDAWLEAYRARGGKAGVPDAFPDGATFAPHASLPRIG
ncbi:MAG: ribonuclease HI [Gemmatimonadetes bacterium]|nr:ribonuclease HI [Gemmatimonadota bacterium]